MIESLKDTPEECQNLIYGPVPSRRLGKSIGINTIPFKNCSYACVYCQLGNSVRIQAGRSEFFPPDWILLRLKEKLSRLKPDQWPDYLTIVPDGEPTLDIHLGQLINSLKTLNIPVAVITNGSLLHIQEVNESLKLADLVSVKVDTTQETTWRNINHPHRSLNLAEILSAIHRFSTEYCGKLITETMMIKDHNDSTSEIAGLTEYLSTVCPTTAYLSVPIRPTAIPGILPANEKTLLQLYTNLCDCGVNVEYLTDYEGNAYASTGNFVEDLLSITAVHPMRQDAVVQLLARSEEELSVLNDLIISKMIQVIHYQGHNYYLRNFKTRRQ